MIALAPMPQSRRTPITFTGKQKMAIMLEKAGYTHEQIAEKMGLSHRESATRLLARAHAAQDAFREAMADFLGQN